MALPGLIQFRALKKSWVEGGCAMGFLVDGILWAMVIEEIFKVRPLPY